MACVIVSQAVGEGRRGLQKSSRVLYEKTKRMLSIHSNEPTIVVFRDRDRDRDRDISHVLRMLASTNILRM